MEEIRMSMLCLFKHPSSKKKKLTLTNPSLATKKKKIFKRSWPKLREKSRKLSKMVMVKDSVLEGQLLLLTLLRRTLQM